jgi:hypothetical protein
VTHGENGMARLVIGGGKNLVDLPSVQAIDLRASDRPIVGEVPERDHRSGRERRRDLPEGHCGAEEGGVRWAALTMCFWTFSKARISIWRTRSGEMP